VLRRDHHGRYAVPPPGRAGESDGRPRRSSQRTTQTAVGRAVLRNSAEIDLIGASFLLLIDCRLDALHHERSNSDEAHEAIASLEDLKVKVKAFLSAASQFVAEETEEALVVESTNSFAGGIANWWSERNVSICDASWGMALFGIGVGICFLAGASGPLAVVIPGAMVGGKPVVEVIKAALANRQQSDPN
jgi:hypothetical protein